MTNREVWRTAAQSAAGHIAESFPAVPFVIVVLSDGSDLTVIGAHVPSVEVLAAIIGNAHRSFEEGSARVVDRTK